MLLAKKIKKVLISSDRDRWPDIHNICKTAQRTPFLVLTAIKRRLRQI